MRQLAALGRELDKSIKQLVDQSLKVVGPTSPLFPFLLKTAGRQVKAAFRRSKHRQSGLYVPPILIMSVTNRCNLKCKGCYSAAQHRPMDGEISETRLRSLLREAQELGVSFALLAGGEPLVRPELLEIASEFDDIVFPFFTNGLLLDETVYKTLKIAKNLIPVVSLEGDGAATDDRRGFGVFRTISNRMAEMKRYELFFGASITVTNQNFAQVVSNEFVGQLTEAGAKLIVFVEYVPVDDATVSLSLNEEQREHLNKQVKFFRDSHRALFISFPGDEEEMGGCLAAGRGFVHISSRGDVEPCPFAPWSDTSLNESSLAAALKSPFLSAIRDNHDSLGETSRGCALWAKRDLVQSLLHLTGKSEGI